MKKRELDFMSKGELLDVGEAEKKVMEHAKKRIKEGVIKDIDIESSEFSQMGEFPVFNIEGYAVITVKEAGRFSKEKAIRKTFKAQVHATSGKVLGFVEE